MTNHVGMLYIDFGSGAQEIINQARTLNHLDNASISCAQVQVRGAECDVLYKHPNSGDSLTFATPTTGTVAPWWDGVADSPTSNAYGFWIEEWTGLDSSHLRRGATPVATRGARFSKLGQGARVMKLNVLLFGADEVALEELFRWLEGQLLNCSGDCFGATMWWRTVCPGSYGDDVGLVLGSGAFLMEGLTWLENPIKSLGCFMRRASFTMGLSDPCAYEKANLVMNETNMPTVDHCAAGLSAVFGCPEDVDAYEPWQLDHALDGVQVGANAPLVYITNDNATKWSPPLMVCAVEDPLSAGAVIDGTDLMGQVWLRGVPPSYEVLVDCAHRRILKRETGTTVWETAEDLIDARSGVPTYPYVTDTDGFVIVRPSFLGDHLSDVLVTIESVRRYGCC